MIRWAVVILAALSWLFALCGGPGPHVTVQWTLIGTALLLGVVDRWQLGDRWPWPPVFLLLLIPLAAALWVLPQAYHPGPLLLGAGVCLSAAGGRRPTAGLLDMVGNSALLLGVILTAQGPVHELCTALAARKPLVPFMGPAVHALLQWAGSDVALTGDTLFVHTTRGAHAFRFTWDHLAAAPAAHVWVGGAVLLWLSRPADRTYFGLTRLSLLLAGYLLIRLFVLVLVFVTATLFADGSDHALQVLVFSAPWVTAASMVPLIPILARRANAAGNWTRTEVPGPPRHAAWPWLASGLSAVGCAGLILGLHFSDPGTPKPGRVLIDEAHSRWARSDRPFDTESYGPQSANSTWCMARFIDHYYLLDVNLEQSLNDDLLSQYDVLMLKIPTSPYAPEEIDALERFVTGGGGLMVVGEHTNLFGSSTILNGVLDRFGMCLRHDCAVAADGGDAPVYFRPRHGHHAILTGVPFLRPTAACSVAGDFWRSRPVMRGSGLWSLPADYAAPDFLPALRDAARARFGTFDYMLTRAVGAGRVAVFGDGSALSNIRAFEPGKPELLLGTLNWLNRVNRTSWVNATGLILCGIALLAAGVVCLWLGPRLDLTAAAVAFGAGGVAVALWFCTNRTAADYAPPEPRRPVPRVVFDVSHGSGTVPVFEAAQEHTAYETLYHWALRPGYFPSVAFDLDRALQGDHPIVLINPVKRFSPRTLRNLDAFLERGGSLVVLDSPTNTESSSADILDGYGMSLSSQPCRGELIIETRDARPVCGIAAGAAVAGGGALLTTEFGEPLLNQVTVGRGRLLAGGLAECFRDSRMGTTLLSVPDAEQRATHELAFFIIRSLVAGHTAEPFRSFSATAAPAHQDPVP